MTTRRTFLQTTAATAALAASCIVPRTLFATSPDPNFFFIHSDSCKDWQTADPVASPSETQS